MVDALRKAESAREAADAALLDPVLVCVLLGLGGRGFGLGGLGDLAGSSGGFPGSLGLLVLNGSLEGLVGARLRGVVCVSFLGDGTAHGVVLADQTRGRSAGRISALDAAADDDGLQVAEFDVDVFLLDARELAVELVGLLRLSHVEARREGLHGATGLAGLARGAAATLLGEVLVPVIDEAEEATEVARVVVGEGVERVLSEDRHVGGLRSCGL